MIFYIVLYTGLRWEIAERFHELFFPSQIWEERFHGKIVPDKVFHLQDSAARASSQKVRDIKATLGIQNGGNHSPQLGVVSKLQLNRREMEKLDIEYQRILDSWLEHCFEFDSGFQIQFNLCYMFFISDPTVFLHLTY